MNTLPLNSSDISKAAKLIEPHILKTPLKNSPEIDQLVGAKCYFKCENMQQIKAFKARGALNAVLQMSEQELEHGLITHSSGNHAQAIAFAGKLKQTKTVVVMPHNAPEIKINKVKSLGAEVHFCDNTPEARSATTQGLIDQFGYAFVHPFDNIRVIEGQATVAKEMLEEIPDLDYIITPVGGGGLLSGTGLSAAAFSNKCKVYAAEPEGAADAIKSFKSGKVEKADYVKTIADGLLTNLSELTLSIIMKTVQDIFIVSEEQIIAAMSLIEKHLAMKVEPSAAVGLATVLMNNKSRFEHSKTGIVITGGNISEEQFDRLVSQ